MSIYTRFGSACTIELAGMPDSDGRIPVDIILHGEGAVASSRKKTWAHELRANDGAAEISVAIQRARPAP